MKLHAWNSAIQCQEYTILLLFVFYKFFPGGGEGSMPPDLPSRLGALRRRSSDNTDKICSGLAPLEITTKQSRNMPILDTLSICCVCFDEAQFKKTTKQTNFWVFIEKGSRCKLLDE